MTTNTPQTILLALNKIAPYPQCYSLDQAKKGREDQVRQALLSLNSLGLVRLHNYAKCGFEMVRGEYATLTPRGLSLINKSATAQEATPDLRTSPDYKPEESV